LEVEFYSKRTHNKRNLTVENEAVSTTKEVIIDTKKAKESQLYSADLAIYHASYDKAVMEERDLH